MFVFGARNFDSRRIWYEKPVRREPALENGVDLWRRFLERVSWL